MRLVALIGLCLLGACDFPEYPTASNPYDPAFQGPRQIAAVDSIWVAASTSTSVTLAWSDPSSFEAGFRLVQSAGMGPLETVAVTAPDVTTYTVPLPVATGRPTFRVTAIADAGAESPPTGLDVRYDGNRRLTEVRPPMGDGVLSPDGRVLYSDFSDNGRVEVYDLASNDTTSGGPIDGVDSLVGFLRSGAAVLVNDGAWPSGGRLGYVVVQGTRVVSSGALADPEAGSLRTSFWNGGAGSPDGQTLVGLVLSSANEFTLVAWDLRTGEILQRGLGGRAGLRVLAVTDDGLALVWNLVGERDDSPAVLQAVRLDANTVAWERPLGRSRPVPTPAYDPESGTLLVREGGAYVILDVQTGAVVAQTSDRAAGSDEQPVFVSADRFAVAGPSGFRLFEVGTMSEVRRLGVDRGYVDLDPSRPSVRLVGRDVVSYDQSSSVVARTSLDGEWVVVSR